MKNMFLDSVEPWEPDSISCLLQMMDQSRKTYSPLLTPGLP